MREEEVFTFTPELSQLTDTKDEEKEEEEEEEGPLMNQHLLTNIGAEFAV